MKKLKNYCFGEMLLVSSVLLSGGFSYWLIAESDDEKVHRVFVEHDRLVLEGRRREARELFEDALKREGEGALAPIWSPLVRAQGNGYVQLEYYIRILAGDPDRELTYKEIASLIETAPKVFHEEVKPRYLSALRGVSGIKVELLAKYGLLL
jgi:hypothetical protein